MKKQRKILELGVCATNKCNRGCKHCSVSATNNGTSFAKRHWVRKLVKEAKRLNYIVKGTITGLGEPLMHPKIVSLMEAFVGLKVCRSLDILTSGFLAKDIEEGHRFREIANRQWKYNIGFNLSFNLYSSTASERLEQALVVLFTQKGRSFIDIDLTCDRLNYFETFYELYEVLSCIGVKLGMDINPFRLDYEDESFKLMLPSFLTQEYDDKNELELFGNSLYIPCIYRVSSKKYGDKFLRMNVSMTTQTGFAKNLSAQCFSFNDTFKCTSVLFGQDKASRLLMNPDGEIFATCDCLLRNLPLGTWETPLSKLILRKSLLQKHLMRLVLSDNSMSWEEWTCEECVTLAKRSFCFD